MLLLMRASTGEAWNSLMYDCGDSSDFNGKKCIKD